jgi:hypothetical protein
MRRAGVFNNLPQSDIDIVAPDGTVRHKTKAIVGPNIITIPDSKVIVMVGDECVSAWKIDPSGGVIGVQY